MRCMCCRVDRAARKRYERRIEKVIRTYQKTLLALHMTLADAKLLYLFFTEIDADGSGEVDLDEFFSYLGLKQSPWSRRVFTLFDADGSGEIDFREFVVALYSYCTADKPGLIAFAYQLYDTDGSKLLDLEEVTQLIREVYGDEYKSSRRAQRLMVKIQEVAQDAVAHLPPTTSPPDVTEATFTKFCRKNPALLFPAFQLQRELQERVMGVKFWNRQTKGRYKHKVFQRGIEEMQEFMAGVHEQSFRELVETGEIERLQLSDDEEAPNARVGRGPLRAGVGRAGTRQGAGAQSTAAASRGGGPGGRQRGSGKPSAATRGRVRLLRKRDLEERRDAERREKEAARSRLRDRGRLPARERAAAARAAATRTSGAANHGTAQSSSRAGPAAAAAGTDLLRLEDVDVDDITAATEGMVVHSPGHRDPRPALKSALKNTSTSTDDSATAATAKAQSMLQRLFGRKPKAGSGARGRGARASSTHKAAAAAGAVVRSGASRPAAAAIGAGEGEGGAASASHQHRHVRFNTSAGLPGQSAADAGKRQAQVGNGGDRLRSAAAAAASGSGGFAAAAHQHAAMADGRGVPEEPEAEDDLEPELWYKGRMGEEQVEDEYGLGIRPPRAKQQASVAREGWGAAGRSESFRRRVFTDTAADHNNDARAAGPDGRRWRKKQAAAKRFGNAHGTIAQRTRVGRRAHATAGERARTGRALKADLERDARRRSLENDRRDRDRRGAGRPAAAPRRTRPAARRIGW